MESEINSLSENDTWELIGLSVGAKAIVFKWKNKSREGCINKLNTRHNARSFSQRQDIDCSEARSPVAKLGTIRTVLNITAEKRMHLTQFDASTAFLYGDLEETIHMQEPEG
ncbi:retrovirus-related Pol polyprotein from transposon TNT 1-94 [Trichonephila clavipes]|nr:retrovirus-related Pol polyprotein from transposon TNT 1-94 [Trichonephila clavipes]